MILLQFFLLLFFSGCMVLNKAGLNPKGDLKGTEAKNEISESIRDAEAQALAFWLAQNGMEGGLGSAAGLIVINGYLASYLYPYVSKIEENSFYNKNSVEQCKDSIETKGALLLGLSYNSLPPSGLGASVRDPVLLESFASCNLKKSGSLIYPLEKP